jgi:hypothetical protein
MTPLTVFLVVFAIFALGVLAGSESSKKDDSKNYAQHKPAVYVRKRK